MKSSGKLPLFSGTASQSGVRYAEHYLREIAGFYTQEFGIYKYSQAFVRACQRQMDRDTPLANAFMRGMAKNSLLTQEHQTLLLLHEEELYHRKLMKKSPHCSAAGIATKGRKKDSVLGQNWDWSSAYFPWISFNRFKLKGQPRVLALSFPGLPVCAGINSAGLSLMWTGAGYYPAIEPKVGIPTYALTFELLHKKSVAEAVEWLGGIKNAGAFIFFLADRKGELAVIEGVPGKIFVSSGAQAHRANVFELPEACRAARQRLPKKCNSRIRNRTFARQFPRLSRTRPLHAVQSILSTRTIQVETGPQHATLVQLVAVSSKRELYIRLWRQPGERWKRLSV